MTEKEMLQRNIEDFSRLQRYMRLADKDSEVYAEMKERYIELKVILTADQRVTTTGQLTNQMEYRLQKAGTSPYLLLCGRLHDVRERGLPACADRNIGAVCAFVGAGS